VLSRITPPTSGCAEVRGRVGSLLEVGTGFHNELTGRENIYLSGAILGMRRAEIARKFDRIVDFAEIEKFIDTPVKHYSSGMYLRLAFAVAAHLEPAILMVDEVLAVGDLNFQRKCLGQMQEVTATGQTIILVSHDLTAVSRLASRSLVLQNGRVTFFGSTEEALHIYTAQRGLEGEKLAARNDRKGDGLLRMEALRIYDARGRAVDSIGSGEAATIAVAYTTKAQRVDYNDLALDVRVTDMMGHPITTFSTRFHSRPHHGPLSARGTLCCHIPRLSLAEETYGIDLWLAYRGGLADYVIRAGELRVVAGRFFATGQEPVKRRHGAALIEHEWRAEDVSDDTLDPVFAAQGRES